MKTEGIDSLTEEEKDLLKDDIAAAKAEAKVSVVHSAGVLWRMIWPLIYGYIY